MNGLAILLPLVAAALALGLAVAALTPRRRGAVHWVFAAGMLAFAAQEVCRYGLSANGFDGAPFWWAAGRAAAAFLLPVPWLLFGLLYAEAQPRARLRQAWPWVAGVSLASLASLAGLFSGWLLAVLYIPDAGGKAVVLTGAGKLAHAALVLALVLTLVQLESTLRHARGVERWRVKYLVLGVYAAFAAQIYEASQTLLFPVRRLEASPVESSGILLALLLVGVAFLRHRSVHSVIYISRPMMYRSVTVALVGGYLLALGVSGQLLRSFGIAPGEFFAWVLGFAGLLGLAVVILSERVRRRLRLFIDTHFYRNKYDYRRRWVEFTRSLGPAIRLDEVLPRLVETLMQTMWVERAGVFLAGARGKDLVLAHASASEGGSAVLAEAESVRAALEAGQVVDLGRRDGGGPPGAAFALLAPMQGPEGLLGALAVGPELTGKPFTPEDCDLLATIASQAATAILTARLSQDLAAAKGMEALHRVAAFLLHDLKNCASVLTMVAENAREHIGNPVFQQEALGAISASATKMRRLIGKLSGLPAELEIEREPMDVAQVVEEVLEEFRKGLKAQVVLKVDLRPTGQILGHSSQVGRVVTNLLVNAAEAVGEAGEVSVETFPEGSWSCIRVRDTGLGIPAATLRNGLFQLFRSTKPSGLGVGLYQCKTIAEAHGGRIEVHSQEGVGSAFTLFLPVTPNSA